MNRDTIYAVATGRPPAAIAILRISGPDALAIGERLAGTLPRPGHAALRALADPGDGTLLDRGLVLTFHGPASATGEDVVELHLHGGRAVIAAVERVIEAEPRTRRAEPGEFTRRALFAGRIDLAEAEGLGDLLFAETEAQRRAALSAAEGAVSRATNFWATKVSQLAARLEAMIDFADEDDVATDDEALTALINDIAALEREISDELARPRVDRLRDGIRVVFAGPPNAGKSSLFNAMAERDSAIVSPVAGTTRDRLEAPVARNGVAYVLIDTAGLRDDAPDNLEAIGIDRARAAAAAADIVLWLGDDDPDDRQSTILLHSRVDMTGRSRAGDHRLPVSALTGEGVSSLWEEIERRSYALLPVPDQVPLNQRQWELCNEAATALAQAKSGQSLVIIAEHLREARVALDRITGRAGIEQVLDAMFSRFCLGK